MADVRNHCIDRVIPDDLNDIAEAIQAREHALSEPAALEMAIVSGKLWKPGRTLRILFLDGDPRVHRKVEQVAKEWLAHANLHFEFVKKGSAEIRISFQQEGHWSAVGTDCLVTEYFPADQPTMNFEAFTFDTPDVEYSRTVLHEFGHALGCVHEHSSPGVEIKWNKDVVYRELAGAPNNWDKSTVDHNVFFKYSKTITQYSKFDSRSIMLYSFPNSWTTDGKQFSSNTELSDSDKQFIASRYPMQKRARV